MIPLDAGGALLLIPFFIVFHFGLTVLTEGAVLRIFNYNTFGRSLRDAFIANFLSLFAGFIALAIIGKVSAILDINSMWSLPEGQKFAILLLTTFVITILVENKYLQSKNETLSYKTLLIVSLIGNALTYLLLLLFYTMTIL